VESREAACWDADGVRGRNLQLGHFLTEHGIDVCLLSEKHLEPGRALRFANYVCHRRDCPARGAGTAILVRRDIDRYAVPVSGLQYLEANDIHVELTNRLLKLVPAYL